MKMFAEPTDALAKASPADRAVAELKALVGGGLTKSAFLEIARAVKIVSPDAGSWTAPKMADSLQRLTRNRVVGEDGVIDPAWREALILRVVSRPNGRALAEAVRAAAPRSWRESGQYGWRQSWPYHDVDLARAARLMVIADKGEEVERLIAIAQAEARTDGRDMDMGPPLLAGVPAQADFLDALSPNLRDRVAAAHLGLLLDHGLLGAGVPAMIAAYRDREQGWEAWPRLDQALLRLDILSERPAAARTRIARLRALDPVRALAGEAALAFLEGPADASLPRFREALKQHRKVFGRRKVILPGDYGIYHLLALFASGDAAARAELSPLLDIAVDGGAIWAHAMGALLLLLHGRDHDAKIKADSITRLGPATRQQEGPLAAAIGTLALVVIDADYAAAREQEDRRAIAHWGEIAPLALRVLAEAHARAARPPADGGAWRSRLNTLGPGYARRFLEIVPVKQAWERTLDRLQGFLAPPSETTVKADPAAQTRRLVFRLDPETSEITPIEQAAKGAGWTAGRPVAMKRLHQRDPRLDYLTPEDQRVIQTLRLTSTYYGEAYVFDARKGPLALIGHPRVFNANAPDERVDLVAYPVELVVREEGDTIRIELSHPADVATVYIEPETDDRWRVIEVTPALVELGQVLGRDGLIAPREARERVIAMVRTENPRLPVRSELAGVATAEAEGDATPVLQIAPRDGAFLIRALVRPLGETGPSYPPGLGARSVLVPAGGAHRRIHRDLQAESAALEAVAAACPALESWRVGDHDWRIDDLDATLEALQELHAFQGPLRVEWPEGASLKPTRTVGAGSMSMSIASAKDWFDIKGQIQVDDGLVIDMAEVLARLGGARGRFVPLDDGRFLALTDELRRRLEAFAAVTEGAKGGRRIGAVGAMAVEELMEGAGSVKTDRRWSALIARIADARGLEPEPPATLEAELRDYQRQGFAWMARLSRLELGACLADDMGLGKTVQTLALLLHDAAKGPSLVVAPTSVCHNWVLEAARFAPTLKFHTLASAPDRATLIDSLGPGDVLVVSYGVLHTEADALASRRFAVAVFDEAQNLKNADTRRAQASKRIDAAFRLALTGTPIENRLEELWSLYDTVTPGLLGSRESFQRRFTGPIERGQAGSARQALKTLVRPYLLRRTKATVLSELPSRTEITVEVEPGPEERAFYEAVRRKALETLAGDEDTVGETDAGVRKVKGGGGANAGGQKRIRILAEIMRLRRAACHPALVDPASTLESAKLAALLDLAAELREGRHRALVFSQFTGHLDLAEAAMTAEGVKLLRLDGATPAKERARRVAAFQAGEGEIFLISLKAGGSGLNLTGADYVIHLDPWWNPAVEDQATDRAHRIGQTRPVTVYRLVVKDSIEEKILDLHAAKRTLSADFLEDAESAAALGEDELMALIRGV
jgi:superfamily II DNA or RNA helicase